MPKGLQKAFTKADTLQDTENLLGLWTSIFSCNTYPKAAWQNTTIASFHSESTETGIIAVAGNVFCMVVLIRDAKDVSRETVINLDVARKLGAWLIMTLVNLTPSTGRKRAVSKQIELRVYGSNAHHQTEAYYFYVATIGALTVDAPPLHAAFISNPVSSRGILQTLQIQETLVSFAITMALITLSNQIPGFHCQPTLSDLQNSTYTYNTLIDSEEIRSEISTTHLENLAEIFVKYNVHERLGVHLIHGHAKVAAGNMMLGRSLTETSGR